MSIIEDIVDRTLDELWGWSPKGVAYTYEQQANAVRSEIQSCLRDAGATDAELFVRFINSPDTWSKIHVRVKRHGFKDVVREREIMPAEPIGNDPRYRSHWPHRPMSNMQAHSVDAEVNLDNHNIDEIGGES